MFARSRPNEIESSFSTERLGNRSLAKKEEERKGGGEETTNVARPTVREKGI